MKVSNVLECHACESPLLAELSTDLHIVFCPKCGAPNGPGAATEFFDPIYVSEQLRRINDHEKWMAFIKDRRPAKITACGDEFLNTLKVILYKKMSPQELKEIVGIALAVGDIGKAIDEYVNKGGLYDGTEEEVAIPKE